MTRRVLALRCKGGTSFNAENNQKRVLHASVIFINDSHDFSRKIRKWFFFRDSTYIALPVIIRADNEWVKARVLRKTANETSI